MRLTTAGALDSAFSSVGKVITPIGTDGDAAKPQWRSSGTARSCSRVRAQRAARSAPAPDRQYCVARYSSNGTLDATGFNAAARCWRIAAKLLFAFDSDFDSAYAVFITADGNCCSSGRCRAGSVASTGVFCSARLLADGNLDSTWGSGGKAIQPSIANERDLTYAAALQITVICCWPATAIAARATPSAWPASKAAPPPACAQHRRQHGGGRGPDGLLIVRYICSALRGAALTSSAVGNNRPATPRRSSHLAGLLLAVALDADNDGQMLATTDGC